MPFSISSCILEARFTVERRIARDSLEVTGNDFPLGELLPFPEQDVGEPYAMLLCVGRVPLPDMLLLSFWKRVPFTTPSKIFLAQPEL